MPLLEKAKPCTADTRAARAGDDDRDAEKQGEEEDGAFDVSNIRKGKLGKRAGAGPKRGGKKCASEGADKKKADAKKPKQKVC